MPVRFLAWLFLSLALGAQEPALADRLQQQALDYAKAQSTGLSGEVTLRVLRPPMLPRLPEGTVRFEPTHISKSDFAGPFFVAFRIFVDQRPAGSTRVDLEGKWKGTLLRTRTALPRQAVPAPEQLESVPFEGTPPSGAITEIPSGFQLRFPVGAGHVLTKGDLQAIPVVKAGDAVRLELTCGPLTVTSDAVALSGGGLGERIRLELPNARRSVQAIITAPGEARISWAVPAS